MKFIDTLINDGDFQSFQQSYLDAKKENKDKFTHAGREYEISYGEAVCKLIENYNPPNK